MTHAVLIAAVAARNCRPRVADICPSKLCTRALAALHATSKVHEQPQRRVRDEMRSLEPRHREIAAGDAVKMSKDAPTTPTVRRRVRTALVTTLISGGGRADMTLPGPPAARRTPCPIRRPARPRAVRPRATRCVVYGRTTLARRAAAPGVRTPHQKRSRPSTKAMGTPVTSRATSDPCSGPNSYGSLGRMTGSGPAPRPRPA